MCTRPCASVSSADDNYRKSHQLTARFSDDGRLFNQFIRFSVTWMPFGGCHSVDAIRWMPFSGYNRCHPTHAILLMRAVQSPVGVCTPQSLPGNQRYIPFPPAIASSIYTVPSSDCQSSLAFASHFIRRLASKQLRLFITHNT